MALAITRDPGARASLNRQYEYELHWTAETDYLPGSLVELRSHAFRALVEWRLMHVEMEGADFEYRWPAYPKTKQAFDNRTRALMRARLPYGARAGQSFRLCLIFVSPQWAGIDSRLSLWVAPGVTGFQPESLNGEYEHDETDECALRVTAAPVRRLAVYARPTPTPDGKIAVCLCPQDHLGNPSAFPAPVSATLSWEGETQTITIQNVSWLEFDPPAGIGRLGVSVSLDALDIDSSIENGVHHDGAVSVESNPVWADRPNGLCPAFGEFHWHTDFSGDGQRPMEEALRCARDELAFDYAAPGDHNPMGDSWQQTVAVLEGANEENRFVTFFGWENSSAEGHENYYFTDPNHPLRCGGEAGIRGGRPADVHDVVAAYDDALAIPHHTNAVAETRRAEDDVPVWQSYSFGRPAPAHRLFEIIQCRGNQEANTYDDAWYGWHQNHGASFRDALARGWKMGVTGGTDNHCGWPGRAHALSDRGACNPPWTQSLTGVWTPSLSRQRLFDSLYARCTWAAWNTRALLWVTVNDTPMGGELTLERAEALRVRIRLSAESPVRLMELIRDGEVAWRGANASSDVDQTVELAPAQSDGYVYLRARLLNGGILYASPVFWSIGAEG